jgi:hypothetical protein
LIYAYFGFIFDGHLNDRGAAHDRIGQFSARAPSLLDWPVRKPFAPFGRGPYFVQGVLQNGEFSPAHYYRVPVFSLLLTGEDPVA